MKTQMINFIIPKPLLTKIDRLAKKEMRSRSEFLREAARRYLEERRERERLFESIRETAERINLPEEETLKLAEEAKKWARNR